MKDITLKQSRFLRVITFGLVQIIVMIALIVTPVTASPLTSQKDSDSSPVTVALTGNASAAASGSAWETVTTNGTPIAREEAGFVYYNGKFYLIGGHSLNFIDIFDPVTNTWTQGAKPPLEIHHIQAMVFNNLIYVISAYTGTCCNAQQLTPEHGVSNIYTYNPATNVWSVGDPIPVARQRGSVGVVLYNNKFYLMGGLTGGHGYPDATSYAFFDVYDPVAHTWTTLPPAPHARDHFEAALVGTKFYAIGGRNTGALINGSPNTIYGVPVPEIDVYDFSTGQWSTLPASANIPTPRGGVGTVVINNQIIVIGGELEQQQTALNQVESFDTTTNTWTTLPPLNDGRHGTQAAVCNGNIYIASGAGLQGGSNLLTSMERYRTAGAGSCSPPANDNFANSTPVTTTSYSNQTNASATLEAKEQKGSCEGTLNIQSSVWYRYTALGTENVTFTVSGSTPVKSISVWRGPSLGSLTQVGCGSGASASTVVTTIKGTAYHIRIGSSNGVGSTFTVAATAVNSVPLRNNFTTGTPTLTWNRVTNATGYTVQVSKSMSFGAGTIVFTSVPPLPVTQLSVQITPALTEEGIYYWRVSANGGTTWSAIDSFVVDLS
jgi:hypothetical protein